MPRFFLWVTAAALLAPVPQDSDLKQALALEKAVQKVIQDADPSIACVLVSRSDLYARFGQGPARDNPGRLGAFDPEALKAHPLFGQLSTADKKLVLARLDLADPSQVPEASGSGLVIDERGLVLTPYHLVQGAAKIYVCLGPNQAGYADVYAADPRSDLAVLRLVQPNLSLRPAKLGDGGKVERGQFVVGLAAQLAPGFRRAKASAAWGIVSNLRQRLPGALADEERGKTIHHYGSLLQTDARVNLGTTGGVLFDLRGEAVALVNTLTAITGPDTGHFAIPIDQGLQRVIDVLRKGQEVEYGFLGVSFEPAGDKADGVVLRTVTEGSPADLAGLKAGHVILAVNDQPVLHNDDLLRLLATQLAGAKVRLEVRNPGMAARQKIDVTLAKYVVAGTVIATEPGSRPFFRGLRVDYTSLLAQQPNFTSGPIPRGVLVTEVQADSPAAKADLKVGFIVTHVNDRIVTSPAAFYDIVLQHKGPVELTLHPAEAGQAPPKVTLP